MCASKGKEEAQTIDQGEAEAYRDMTMNSFPVAARRFQTRQPCGEI
jgi:hypothetical protein